ncbi:MAG TPA: hypothetical protein VG815_08005 [Chloroflexota bacterium]|nr:hypothetical protein [Chloroflexota bacterium]
MLRRALLLVPLVLFLGRPRQAEAGPVMISVNTTMAKANGMLDATASFTINTGTTATPTTSFTLPDGQTFNGRVVNQANGPPIVVYDLTDLSIARRVDVSLTGMNPIAFLTTNNISISGALDANGQNADGSRGGAGGAGGGNGGVATKDGSAAPGANTGQGMQGGNNTIPGGGGGGGYGGTGGAGTTAGQAVGNTKGGDGGAMYGQRDLSVLFGGGGGGGAKGASAAGGGGGGGAIMLFAEGDLSISGAVTANGGRSSIADASYGGGGGAGGSILLEDCLPGEIQIKGRVSARGGAGGDSTTMAGAGGGGGGGRAYIADPDVSLDRVSVNGGVRGINSGKAQAEAGMMGTKVQGMSMNCTPEPSSFVLLVAGIGILAASRMKVAGPRSLISQVWHGIRRLD